MDQAEHRRALADFLRTQRARLAPADVGLAAGFRRRTPGLRRDEVAKLPNWEQIARATLAEFRTANAHYPGDHYVEELVEDLKQISPEFCRWWSHHDARSTLDGYKAIVHPAVGTLEFEQIVLQPLSAPDIRIMIYTPLPATRAKLEQLLYIAP